MTKYVNEKVATMERPVTIWLLISAIGFLIFCYGYFVNSAIMNIIAVKNMEKEISKISSSLSNLESEYFSLKSSLSFDYAKSVGFSEQKENPIFITKSTNSLSFDR